MSTFGDRVYQMGGVPVGSDLLGLVGDGNVFFLDPGKGDDANDGKQPDGRAVATLTRALALCTASQGDVIIRLPGTETVTAVTTANKSGVVLAAATSAHSGPAGRGAGAEYYLMWGPALSNNNVLEIDNSLSISGLSFANASTAADRTGAAVRLTSDTSGNTAGFNYIVNCEFPAWGTNDQGILIDGASHCYIARNSFGGASGTLPKGVALGGGVLNNPVHNVIEDNIFNDVTLGIYFFAGTPQNTQIYRNFFGQLGTANIDFDLMAAGGTGFVAGNWFHGSVSTAVDSIAGGTDTVTGVIGDTGVEFAGNNYLET